MTRIIPCSRQWSEKDREGLKEIRRVLDKELKEHPPFPEVVGDRRLLRFLRGKKHDAVKAIDMIKKHLVWREKNKVNAIRQQIVFGGLNSPFLFPNGKKILDIQEQIVVTPLALDRKGQPLCFEAFDFDPKKVLKHNNIEDYLVFLIYCLEYRSIVMDQMSDEKEQEYLTNHPNPDEREHGYVSSMSL